jgi:hypothetical protein
VNFLNHFLPMITSALILTLYFVANYYLDRWEHHDDDD